jgi:hypothetical protein
MIQSLKMDQTAVNIKKTEIRKMILKAGSKEKLFLILRPELKST